MPSVEPIAELKLTALRSRPELRSGVGRLTNILAVKLDSRFTDILVIITYITFYVSLILLIYQMPHDMHIKIA